jgi:hypothetical protein
MSLKTFHLVFVTAMSSLAFGCSLWRFTVADALFGSLAALVGVGVVIYGIYFLKKLKNVSFL